MKMKLFFLFFLVVLLWSNNHALRCVNYTNPVEFEASNSIEIKKFIDTLDTAEGYKACSTIFGVQYPENIFIVVFGVEISASGGKMNTDVFYQVILTVASNGNIIDPASGLKLFLFKCDDQDTCERQFWRDHIDWFIREKSAAALEAVFRSILMIENKEKVECVAQMGINEGTCPAGTCCTHYYIEDGLKRSCLEDGKRETTVQFTIKISFSTNGNTQDNLTMTTSLIRFEYHCQFDNCNNQLIDNKIIKAINDHFNSSSMYQVIKTNLQDKQTTKFNTGSISYSTTGTTQGSSTSDPQQTTSTSMQPPNTSILHFISMNILILHILFLMFF